MQYGNFVFSILSIVYYFNHVSQFSFAVILNKERYTFTPVIGGFFLLSILKGHDVIYQSPGVVYFWSSV